jgi:hypothetical protein
VCEVRDHLLLFRTGITFILLQFQILSNQVHSSQLARLQRGVAIDDKFILQVMNQAGIVIVV